MTHHAAPSSGDIVYYPNAGDEPVRLVPDPRRFTVRFGRDRDALSAEAESFLRHGSEPVAEIPHYGISVFELEPGRERRQAIPLLNRERAVELAAPVLHRERLDADEVYVTSDFLAAFRPEVTRAEIDALNAAHGVELVEELGYVENGFLLRAPAGVGGLEAIEKANAYRATGLTIWAHPDLVSRRHRRHSGVLTSEPAEREARVGESYVSRQWHLDTARVTDAWSLTRGSSAIKVAVLDDGIDVDHPELTGRVVAQFDFADDEADARPTGSDENHGTACAGVAVAAGQRAAGAAPGCSLIAVRYPAALGDADEARMFKWAADSGADVISCSWGPEDRLGISQPLPGATQAAIRHCLTRGRAGKGTPVLFAAGNGDESVDLDGYAANPDVIAVAASTDQERRASYSDFGNAIWVCAPSNGGERDILTIDRRAASGYNDGSEGVDADYTSTFGGTSSATPLVAGIVGLMLSANPALTATEVRTILRDTATRIDGGYDANGHSPQYGYGRVDAFEAVRSAQAAAGGVTPAPGRPSIVGPFSVDRADGPPSFEVDPGGGTSIFYAVELATRAELFDDANHGGERTATTFYGSWEDSPMQASNPYRLPEHAWARLRAADRLFYRAWLSSSPDAWTDVRVTTADEDAGSAPSLALTGGSSGGGSGGSGGGTPTRPASIVGPFSADRSDPPPSFEIDPGDGASSFYAVELATRAELFDDANHGSERDADTFYGSWEDSPMQASNPYQLPDHAWARLRAAERLFYRAWFSSSADAWTDVVVTTADEDAGSAPSTALTGIARGLRERRLPAGRIRGSRVTDPDELLWRLRPHGSA